MTGKGREQETWNLSSVTLLIYFLCSEPSCWASYSRGWFSECDLNIFVSGSIKVLTNQRGECEHSLWYLAKHLQVWLSILSMCSAVLLIRDAATQMCKYFSYLALEILFTFQLILICWSSLALPQIIIVWNFYCREYKLFKALFKS